jgi:hypothetical protein
MFELSENLEVEIDFVCDSKVFIIDNFYKDPDTIVNFLSTQRSDLWKMEDEYQPSHNGIYFEDRKHQIQSKEIHQAYFFLQRLCHQKIHCLNDIDTNMTRFKRDSFNDYVNCYWSPHRDIGYTAVVYLNPNDNQSGTNLYGSLDPEHEPVDEYSEHYFPWRPKNKYKLLKTLNPKYNRMVMFDGRRFLHGANICNEDYFDQTYRLNQVYFFEYES